MIALILLWQFLLPFFAERHFRDGYNFYMMKRYRYSIEELEKAIQSAPWETHYMVQLGRAYEDYAKQQATIKRKLFYWDKAESLYKKMIELDSLNPWYRNRLALSYIEIAKIDPSQQVENTRKAEELTRQAAELDTQNPLFQLNYASFLHRSGQLDKAIIYYEKVIQYDPRMVEAQYNLADIYRKKNDKKKTLDTYLAAFKTRPDFNNLDLAIASSYLQDGNKELATYYLQHTVDRNPKQLEPLKTLGSIYYQNEDWENTAKTYKTLVTQFPEQYTYHQFHVQALAKLGRVGEALQSLDKHVQRYPKDTLAKKQIQQLQSYTAKQRKK
jgi:tetratricopeptide (TPR) repeat protein